MDPAERLPERAPEAEVEVVDGVIVTDSRWAEAGAAVRAFAVTGAVVAGAVTVLAMQRQRARHGGSLLPGR